MTPHQAIEKYLTQKGWAEETPCTDRLHPNRPHIYISNREDKNNITIYTTTIKRTLFDIQTNSELPNLKPTQPIIKEITKIDYADPNIFELIDYHTHPWQIIAHHALQKNWHQSQTTHPTIIHPHLYNNTHIITFTTTEYHIITSKPTPPPPTPTNHKQP